MVLSVFEQERFSTHPQLPTPTDPLPVSAANAYRALLRSKFLDILDGYRYQL